MADKDPFYSIDDIISVEGLYRDYNYKVIEPERVRWFKKSSLKKRLFKVTKLQENGGAVLKEIDLRTKELEEKTNGR